ncbi:hypothetical protein BVX97_03580 [bacterium E08(2017)]|nr:hypothetical protein BVX97_03580 [bacterium E08(2017)]
MVSEVELIEKGKAGDRDAMAELLKSYEKRIYSYLCRMLSNHHDAEEVTQETFVRVIRNIGKYREEGLFKSWIFQIAYREGLKKIKKRDLPFDLEELPEQEEPTAGPDEILFSSERIGEITEAIQKLPPMEKQVVLLRAYSGMTFKEIAQTMDTPLNTALGRMRNASIRLRKSLNETADKHR